MDDTVALGRDALRELLPRSEELLIDSILRYAQDRMYTQYTSTLREAWRMSIEGLSASIMAALEKYDAIPQYGPEDKYEDDPCSAFGVFEAQKHRDRGIPIEMFAGLLKYYEQAYLDLVAAEMAREDHLAWCTLFIRRVFGRIELGLIKEWSGGAQDVRFQAMEEANRHLANEKNRYLTVFESLSAPVVLLDESLGIVNLNHAASRLFLGAAAPGAQYYNPRETGHPLSWMSWELAAFQASEEKETIFTKTYLKENSNSIFQVRLARMLDVSKKFIGITVVLHDISERERLIAELQSAAAKIQTLSGLIPICAHCKKVRNDQGFWGHIETYISEHSEAEFSHGICPDCLRYLYPDQAGEILSRHAKDAERRL